MIESNQHNFARESFRNSSEPALRLGHVRSAGISIKTQIYILRSAAGEVRYVGKTSRTLRERLSQHISDARRGHNDHRSRWIRCSMRLGTLPVIEAIETCDNDGSDSERRWIALYRSSGARLVNTTDGGEGCLNPSAEVRQKISKALSGRTYTAEQLSRMSEGQRKRCKATARFLFNGERCSLPELARRFGIKKGTLIMRIARGTSLEDAISKPVVVGGLHGFPPANKLPTVCQDLIGMKIKTLTVIDGITHRRQEHHGKASLLVRCDCGDESYKLHNDLTSNRAGCRVCMWKIRNHPRLKDESKMLFAKTGDK